MAASQSASAPEDTDRDLVAKARKGDRSAYSTLYQRYAPIARRVARSRLENEADTDDVVAEVFASVLGAFERGHGPVDSFLPYLIGSVRNECHRANRRRGREPAAAADDGSISATQEAADPYAAVEEAHLLREAFESLPPRFREVLWETEVRGASYGDVGARHRLTRHAVSMLALRARRALAAAYLARLVAVEQADAVSPECQAVRGELARLVRGTAGARQRRRIEEHLRTCAECADLRTRLDGLNRHLLASPLLPAAAASLAIGSVNLNSGITAQLATWWSATAPVAMSSLAVVSVLCPLPTGAPSTTTAGPATSGAETHVPPVPAASLGTAPASEPTHQPTRATSAATARTTVGSPDALDAAARSPEPLPSLDVAPPLVTGAATTADEPARHLVAPAHGGGPAVDPAAAAPPPSTTAGDTRPDEPPAPESPGRGVGNANGGTGQRPTPAPSPSDNSPPATAGPPASLPARTPSQPIPAGPPTPAPDPPIPPARPGPPSLAGNPQPVHPPTGPDVPTSITAGAPPGGPPTS